MKTKPSDTEVFIDLGDRKVRIAESFGRIDLENLAGEIEESGAYCVFYAMLAARAHRREGDAKRALDVKMATLARRTRADAIVRGEKTTENAVTESVQVHPEYEQAYQDWLQARENYELVESVKFSLARKQDTCKELVALLLQERFATTLPPQVPYETPRPSTRRSPL
jgi:hypothetical protein